MKMLYIADEWEPFMALCREFKLTPQFLVLCVEVQLMIGAGHMGEEHDEILLQRLDELDKEWSA